jgi:hypothetical protein
VARTTAVVESLSPDDNQLAWLEEPDIRCARVYRYSFVTRERTQLTRTRCSGSSGGQFGPLVLSGRRAYWAHVEGGNTEEQWAIETAARPFAVSKIARGSMQCGGPGECNDCGQLGTGLGPLAGGDGTLVYSTYDLVGAPGCPAPQPGLVSSSATYRVTATSSGFHRSKVPGARGGALLAFGSGRIALVPYANGQPTTQPESRVEIRDAVSGTLVGELRPVGEIEAIAVWRGWAAVLVKDPAGQRWIERYTVFGGPRVGRTAVGPAVGRTLDIGGGRIAYCVGPEVRVIRLDTGISHLVKTLVRKPGDVEIEGNRVVWYTTHAGGSTIAQVLLPTL